MSPFTKRSVLLAAVLALALGATGARAQSGPVRWVFPNAWQVGVHVGTTVAIQFAQPMDPASVAAALTLEPYTPGQLEWVNPTFVELFPADPLLPERTFYVTLGAGARDAGGRAVLARDLTWAFTTAALSVVPRFSLGLPVQLLTLDGDRGAPVQPGVPRATLTCRLYALDAAGFFARYRDLAPGKANEIAVTGLAPAVTWSARVDASEKPAEIRPPDRMGPGLYVLEVAHARLGTARTLLMYGDYALIAKAGRYDQVVWSGRVADGAPGTGGTVTWFDAAGASLGQSTTDAFGVARRPGALEAAFAVATVGGHASAVSFDGYWSSLSQAGDRGDPAKLLRAPEFIGHTHTDRPIYRPGHTVHYKATLRRFGVGGALLPEPGRGVTVTIRDGAGNVIARNPAALDPFGSLVGELALGEGAGLGAWRCAWWARRSSTRRSRSTLCWTARATSAPSRPPWPCRPVPLRSSGWQPGRECPGHGCWARSRAPPPSASAAT